MVNRISSRVNAIEPQIGPTLAMKPRAGDLTFLDFFSPYLPDCEDSKREVA